MEFFPQGKKSTTKPQSNRQMHSKELVVISTVDGSEEKPLQIFKGMRYDRLTFPIWKKMLLHLHTILLDNLDKTNRYQQFNKKLVGIHGVQLYPGLMVTVHIHLRNQDEKL